MEIKIRENYYVRGVSGKCNNNEQSIHDWYAKNAGKWVEVDTKHLSSTSYTTVDGMSVNDGNVQAVRNDARIGKGKCSACGKVHTIGEMCSPWKEGTIEGVIKSGCANAELIPFDENNTFFIANPNGLPEVKRLPECKGDERFTDKEFKCGSFSLEQLGGSLNRYRLKNARQTFVFVWDSKNQCYWTGDFDKVYNRRTSLCRGHNRISASSFKEEELKAYLNAQE